MAASLADYADTYGYPGPEGPRFWGYLGAIFWLIFMVIASEPLWNHAS